MQSAHARPSKTLCFTMVLSISIMSISNRIRFPAGARGTRRGATRRGRPGASTPAGPRRRGEVRGRRGFLREDEIPGEKKCCRVVPRGVALAPPPRSEDRSDPRGSTRRCTRRSRSCRGTPWNRPPPTPCEKPRRISPSPRAPRGSARRSRRSKAKAKAKAKAKQTRLIDQKARLTTYASRRSVSATRPARSSFWRTRAERTCGERWRRVSVSRRRKKIRPRGRREETTSGSFVRDARCVRCARPSPPSSRAGPRPSGRSSRRDRSRNEAPRTRERTPERTTFV